MKRPLTRSVRRSVASSRQSISRRNLLKLGLAASAGLLSANNQGLARPSSKEVRPRVLIVGAGFSGLSCAYELASAGYEVKVLEARRRVGGRVLSLKNLIPQKNVEGGGELLGLNHPHVLAYAAKFEFEFLEITEEEGASPIQLGQHTLTEREIQLVEQECDRAYDLMTEQARRVNADEPWESSDAVKLDKLTTADWIDGLELSELSARLLTLELTADNGVATERQSYLGNLAVVKGGGLERYWTDTECLRLAGGNQQYALRMASELGDERIVLDCPVREIIVTESTVTAIDAAGVRHQADEIILAIPPSTWSSIRFTPELPVSLSPQMGAQLKFLSVVKQPFWRDSELSANVRTDGLVSQSWHGTDGQSEEGPVALIAFSGGPSAEAIHRLPVAERQTAYAKSFDALLPGYSQNFLKGQVMDWIADPWTRAGYSFPAPGQVTTIGPILHRGLGRMHFAGEHCCYQFVGYMEGALHSGASLAKRIVDRDNLQP